MILVRRETTPDDYHGMIAAQGILTSAGGTNSHAAVVARGEGIPAVCGADAIKIAPADRTFAANGTTVKEGDGVTIDGFTGNVYVGELPLEESVLEKARAGDAEAREQEIWKAFEALMEHADARAAAAGARERRHARPGARTPASAAPRGSACAGPSTCSSARSGCRPCGQMIFAETDEEEQRPTTRSLPLQREDFVGIFRAMDGLPVTVRLLDPPLHEFLPEPGRPRGGGGARRRAAARTSRSRKPCCRR